MLCETEPDLWPIRPRPLPGEVFGGWIARIAQGHGVEPEFFFAHLRNRFRLPPDRNLDTNPSYELLAEVSRRTAVRYDRLVAMTLRWHVDAWCARDVRNDYIGGFGFCPLCWAADPVSYIRRAWRLPWMACQDHRIPLRWQCPQCKRETGIATLGPVEPVSRCVQCEFDLRCSAPPRWPRSQAPEEIAYLLDRSRREFESADTRYLVSRSE